jgi:ribosomal protein S18 acetylase RimI-like enzyme
LIGRLARDERVRGQGTGELLLADAVRRTLGAARSVAVFAIVIDAKDDPAVEFYRRFGFSNYFRSGRTGCFFRPLPRSPRWLARKSDAALALPPLTPAAARRRSGR